MIFDINKLKDNISKIRRVEDSHKYQEVFDAILFLIKSDKSKNTLDAIEQVLENYIDFCPVEIEYNQYHKVINYVADLAKMPINVMKALQKREQYVKTNQEKLSADLENRVVNLLNSDEAVK